MSTLEDIFLLKLALEQKIADFHSIEAPLKTLAQEKSQGKLISLAEILVRFGLMSSAHSQSLQQQAVNILESIHPEQGGKLPTNININECEREKVIGKSPLGETYFASHPDITFGALKCIQGAIAKNRRFVLHFLRQVDKLKNLYHPNCGRIYATSPSDFLILREFAVGDSLGDKLKNGTFKEEEAGHIIIKAAEGLDFAAQFGVLHKNLKPNNLIISEEQDVKVVDFSLPPTSSVYLAPEQCRKEKSDIRSDIYALGVVFYQMLTGQVPFPGNNSREVMQAHIEKEYTPIRELNPGISSDLEKIIDSMLAKAPSRRYSSYSDLKKDLNKVVKTPQPPTPKSEDVSEPEILLIHTTEMVVSDDSLEEDLVKSSPTLSAIALDDDSLQDDDLEELSMASFKRLPRKKPKNEQSFQAVAVSDDSEDSSDQSPLAFPQEKDFEMDFSEDSDDMDDMDSGIFISSRPIPQITRESLMAQPISEEDDIEWRPEVEEAEEVEEALVAEEIEVHEAMEAEATETQATEAEMDEATEAGVDEATEAGVNEATEAQEANIPEAESTLPEPPKKKKLAPYFARFNLEEDESKK